MRHLEMGIYDICVVVAAAICANITSTLIVLNSLLLVEYRNVFGVNTSSASWAGSIFSATSFLFGELNVGLFLILSYNMMNSRF